MEGGRDGRRESGREGGGRREGGEDRRKKGKEGRGKGEQGGGEEGMGGEGRKEVKEKTMNPSPAKCTDPSSPINIFPALTSLQGEQKNSHWYFTDVHVHITPGHPSIADEAWYWPKCVLHIG